MRQLLFDSSIHDQGPKLMWSCKHIKVDMVFMPSFNTLALNLLFFKENKTWLQLVFLIAPAECMKRMHNLILNVFRNLKFLFEFFILFQFLDVFLVTKLDSWYNVILSFYRREDGGVAGTYPGVLDFKNTESE